MAGEAGPGFMNGAVPESCSGQEALMLRKAPPTYSGNAITDWKIRPMMLRTFRCWSSFRSAFFCFRYQFAEVLIDSYQAKYLATSGRRSSSCVPLRTLPSSRITICRGIAGRWKGSHHDNRFSL